MINAAQLLEPVVHYLPQLQALTFIGNDSVDHVAVTVDNFRKGRPVAAVALRGQS